MEVRDGATNSQPIDTTVPAMVLQNWYQLTLTVRPLGGSNFNGEISLRNYGSTGTVPGTVLYSGNANFLNATAAADVTWHGGFFASSVATSNVDNFLISIVPESSPLLLMGAAGFLQLAWRSRKRIRR
jgi:hypothetical protein